jgi:hypothetical protein
MAPPKKNQQAPEPQAETTEPPKAVPVPAMVIVEARLAAHVASALPAFGTQSVLRLKGVKSGVPGSSRSGVEVDSMKLEPRGLVVVKGDARYIIGAGSWVALTEAER